MLATHSPMTEPPAKAMKSAFDEFGLYKLAALAVLTFARVAACIPKRPASIEDIAQPINAIAVWIPRPYRRAKNIIMINTANIVYCLLRYAIAHSCIFFAISRILSFQSGCLLI